MHPKQATIRNGETPLSLVSVADFLDAPLVEPLAALPLAAVSESGEVLHVNEAGREIWGRLDGVRLPAEVIDAMCSRITGGLEPLPVSVAGARVLCTPRPGGDGWLLVGYADTTAWDADQRASHADSTDDTLAEECAVALLRMRTDGVVIYANPEVEALTGYPRVSMLGRIFGLELLYPEDRYRFTSALRTARQQGDAFMRVRFSHADGSLRRAEIRLRHSNRAAEITAVLLDVTEHDEVASALLQSEALYQTFLEQSPVGILHLDCEGIVTFENYRLRTMTGEEADAAWIGRPLGDVSGLDPRLAELATEMLEQGRSFGENDLTFVGSDGQVRTFVVHGAPIRHPDQGIVGGALMVFDVTLERERERELRTRRRYDSAEASLRNAALTLATEHAFLDKAATLLGETAAADHVFVLLPAEELGAYEEEVRWAREPERSLVPLRLDAAVWPTADSLEGMFYARAGRFPKTVAGQAAEELLTGLQAAEALIIPFIRGAGRHGLLLLARNAASGQWSSTERQALTQLGALFETLCGWMRAEERYRQVVTTIEDSLFAFSFGNEGQRSYSFVTRQVEALTGYPPDALLSGDVVWDSGVVHDDDRAAVEAHNLALREGRESRLLYRVRRCDGVVRWLRESATPGRDPAGRLVVAGILSDVTDQKEVEASLVRAKQDAEAANRMKSSFLATMSHELRTPLGAIKGFAELLEEEVQALGDPPDEVLEFAGVIRANAGKVLRLVSDLLDLAKLQTDRLTLDPSPVPLHPLLARSVSRYEQETAGGEVTLTADFEEGGPIVLADARRLEQVMDVLVSNAVKFTESGTITVEAVTQPETVVVRVSDTGIGIAPDYLPHVFEPLSQEDNRLNRDYEGSGLGLALAQRLMTAMQGTIEVDSEKGAGTTFTITLPRADA